MLLNMPIGRVVEALVNAERVADGLPEVAPRDMSEHNDFRPFGPPFSWIPVDVMKDPTDPNSYRKILMTGE